MRRWLLVGTPLLLASAVALGIATRPDGEFLPTKPAALAPELAAWVPLTPGGPRVFDVNSNNSYPGKWTRTVSGWETIDGQPHARIDMAWPLANLHRGEWLRPGRGPSGAAQLVCTVRRLDDTRYRLEPPQPVLQTPLIVGATWSWSGRIGDEPCEANFRVVAVDAETLQIEQRTVAGSLSSTHLRTYALGRGLVRETANLPSNDPAMVDALRQTATEGEPD